MEDLEEEEEDGNTDGGLKEWSVGKMATLKERMTYINCKVEEVE